MITIKFSDIIFNFEINDIMGIELVHTNSYPKISGMISTYYDIGVRIDTKSVPNYLKTLYCQCDKYHNIEKISENPELLEVVNRILIVNKNDWSDFIYNEDIHDGVVNVGIPMSIYNGFDDEKYRYYSNKADNIYDYKNYLRIIRLYDSDNFIIDNFYKLLRINHYMNIVIYIPSKYDIDMNSNFSFNEYDVYSLNLSDMNRMYVSTKAKAIKNLSKYFDFLLIRYDDSN